MAADTAAVVGCSGWGCHWIKQPRHQPSSLSLHPPLSSRHPSAPCKSAVKKGEELRTEQNSSGPSCPLLEFYWIITKIFKSGIFPWTFCPQLSSWAWLLIVNCGFKGRSCVKNKAVVWSFLKPLSLWTSPQRETVWGLLGMTKSGESVDKAGNIAPSLVMNNVC